MNINDIGFVKWLQNTAAEFKKDNPRKKLSKKESDKKRVKRNMQKASRKANRR